MNLFEILSFIVLIFSQEMHFIYLIVINDFGTFEDLSSFQMITF